MTKVLEKLLEVTENNQWLFLLAAGVVLGLAGAVGEVPKFGLAIDYPGMRWGLAVFGAILVVAGVFGYFISRRNTRRSRDLDPKQYDMKILSPMDDGTVNPPEFKIVGTLKKPLAEGVELWVFAVGYPQGDPVYWPRSPAKFVNRDNQFEAIYSTGQVGARERRAVRFFLVGGEGQALISCYHRINRHYGAPSSGQQWEGITKLTSDVVSAGADKYHLYFQP